MGFFQHLDSRSKRWPRIRIAGVDFWSEKKRKILPEWKIREKPDHQSLFIFGSSRSLYGLYKCHRLSKILLNFGWVSGCQSLNRSRILKFEKNSDQDSKILEQQRSQSLKMWFQPSLL